MKKIIVIVLILFLIILVINIDLFNKNYKTDPKKVKQEINTNIELFLDKNATKKDLEKITGNQLSSAVIAIGKDSLAREKISEKLIKKYNLEEYAKKQEVYAENLETEILNNMEYKLTNSRMENNEVYQTVEIKGYYYGLYSADLMELTSALILKEKETNQDVRYYKAKIKAMEIMDKYLKDYVNEKEIKRVDIIYKNGKAKDSDELFSLLLNIEGMTYDNTDFNDSLNVQKQKERMKTYLQEN